MAEILSITVKVENVKVLLEKYRPQMEAALPKFMDGTRMLRIFQTATTRTPALLDCTPASLVGCFIECGQLGLEPDGVLGHAWLIPYKTTATFIPGYKGLMELAKRSGRCLQIEARTVYEGDKFEYRYGLNPVLNHTPTDEPEQKPVFFYAIARLKGGLNHFEVMSKAQVDDIRRQSKAGQSGPWVTHYEEMGKKTVVRRVCKYLSLSPQLDRAVALDERAEAGIPQQIEPTDITPEPKKPGLEILTAAMNGEASPEPAPTSDIPEWREAMILNAKMTEKAKPQGGFFVNAQVELKSGEKIFVYTQGKELMEQLCGAEGELRSLQITDERKQGDEKPFFILHRLEEIVNDNG